MNTANLPQANRLDRVREFVEHVARCAADDDPVSQSQEFGKRDNNYYLRAATSLGLIALIEDGGLHRVTDRGQRLLASAPR
ncbi:MAG TPA: hypothetical protein ENK31_01795, partial [Nannocystis exedens]|nr:hypothetical protein [Nannocystis exedens]